MEWRYDYGLYDNVTGAVILLDLLVSIILMAQEDIWDIGVFGCQGYSDYPSGASSVAIVQEDTDINMTLHSAPGKLTKLANRLIHSKMVSNLGFGREMAIKTFFIELMRNK